jgi:hypothetical protein
MQAGDLVKFHYSIGNMTPFRPLVGKLALYLGERPIHRGDGVTVNNFEIHVIGENKSRICDQTIKSWLSVVNASR